MEQPEQKHHTFLLIDGMTSTVIARSCIEEELAAVGETLCEINGNAYLVCKIVGSIEPPEPEEDTRDIQARLLSEDPITPREIVNAVLGELVPKVQQAVYENDQQQLRALLGPIKGMLDGVIEISPKMKGSIGAMLAPMQTAIAALETDPTYVGDLDRAIAKWMVTKDPQIVCWLIEELNTATGQRRQSAEWAINSLCQQSERFRSQMMSASTQGR